jgi:hypothetical protein
MTNDMPLEPNNQRVRRVDFAGIVSTFAGTFGNGGDNGPATSAQIGFVHSIAVDAAGSLYIADFANRRACRVEAVGPLMLQSVVSRKIHGSAGTFLPLTRNPGVECRCGGANSDYTSVFIFANP